MKRVLLIAIMCGGSASASAQAGVRWEDLALKPGTVLLVQDTLKRTWEGALDSLTPSFLRLRVGAGSEVLTRRSVIKISRPGDSVWDGFRNGFIFGAIAGLFATGMECPDTHSTCKPGRKWMIVPMGGLVYGLFGMGIDARIKGKTVIYDAGSPR
jgi:hypothetical protein